MRTFNLECLDKQVLADVVAAKGAPLKHCIGLIDEKLLQRAQTCSWIKIAKPLPNGIIDNMYGPIEWYLSIRFSSHFASRRCSIAATVIVFILLTQAFIRQTDLISSFAICTSPDTSIYTSDIIIEAPQVPACDTDRTQQVILLTYGRSGSSLTADIVQQHPDVFFYYEPLHDLSKTYSGQQLAYSRTHRGSHLHLTNISEYLRRSEDILESWMTCNYTKLPRVAYHNLHMIRAKGTSRLARCLEVAHDRGANVHKCLYLHSVNCRMKPLQFLKVIRLPTVSVGRLMAKNPRLKMIFLLRDPRGSFLSKKRTFGGMISSNTTYEAERFCVRLVKDVRETFRLHRKYPGRVLMTRYESLAADPVESAKDLYKFLCLQFTPDIENYILRNTMAKDLLIVKDPYSLKRRNSSVSSYSWRQTISFSDVKEFDIQCKEVYHRMGYLPVDNEEQLRNMNMPLKVEADLVT